MVAHPKPMANKAALGFIFAVLLLDVIGLTILIPVQAFIVRQYSDDALMVSLITVLYAIAQFFAAPLLGTLSDRYGRRPVLLISMLGSAVGYVIFGIGGALWILFLSRLIDGFTGGNISTASAYITDVTSAENRAKGLALLGVALGLGFIIGPALGGLLGQISLTAPAYAAAILSLLSAIFGFVALPESLPPEKRLRVPWRWADLNPFIPIIELLQRPLLRSLLITQSIFNFVVFGYNSVAPVFFIDTYGVNPGNIAWLLVLVGVANVIVQAGFIGRLVQALGERRLAIISVIFQAGNLAAIALISRFWMMYPISLISTAGAGSFRPTVGALLSHHVSADEQGKLNGVVASLGSLMSIFGPLWAGATYDHLAPRAPLWLGATLLLIALLLLVRFPVALPAQGVAAD